MSRVHSLVERWCGILNGLFAITLSGCYAVDRTGEHRLVPWMGDREINIIDKLEVSLVDARYNGFALVGRAVLFAVDEFDIPRVLDHRTLWVRHVWDCETGLEVPRRVQVDYAPVRDSPGFEHLAVGQSYSAEVRFPVFSKYYTPQGGPNCIWFLVVYSRNGWFIGANTEVFIGKVSKNTNDVL
jgi:hypothetical protein